MQFLLVSLLELIRRRTGEKRERGRPMMLQIYSCFSCELRSVMIPNC